MASFSYQGCTLCARRCGVDRTAGERGVCGMDARMFVARAALHYGEEPPLSGTRGSGAVFFVGCSLGCVFCQNRAISRGAGGEYVTPGHLARIFLSLQEKGAANINLVTPTHYAPSLAEAVRLSRGEGLTLPIVYNTSSYDTPETLRALAGTVDVYLPDLKYTIPHLAQKYSRASDYPAVAMAAIAEMMRQAPHPLYDAEGMMTRGVIARVLLLPGALANAKLAVRHLYENYGDDIVISLMNQYTPMPGMTPPLDRGVSRGEYRELVEYADRLGVKNAFVQEQGCVGESFIPAFDGTGVQ